jgi:hypothetical protein
VPYSDTLDKAQLAPTTQLSDLIELACRWNKSIVDLGNVDIRVLLKEPSPRDQQREYKTPSQPGFHLRCRINPNGWHARWRVARAGQSRGHLVISLASSTTTNYEWSLVPECLPCELRAQLTPATFNLEVCGSPKRQSVRTDWRFFTGQVRLSASVTTLCGERIAVTRVDRRLDLKKWGTGA